MLRKRGQKGFTLIELLIVIAIIGILAAIAVPMYRAQTVKAKMSEVTNSMSSVADAIKNSYNDNGYFPGAQTDATMIKNSLGVGVPTIKYIGSAWTTAAGVISFRITGTGESLVDGSTLTLTPSLTPTGAIDWTWAGLAGSAAAYLPRK